MLLQDQSGLAQGISQAGSALASALAEGMKKRADYRDLQAVMGITPQQNIGANESFRQNFVDMINNYQQETGEKLSDKQLDNAWNMVTQQAQPQQGGLETKEYSLPQLAYIANRFPHLAPLLQQQTLASQRAREKRTMAMEKRAYESNKPFLDEISKLRESVPQREVNLLRMGEVLGSKDMRTLRNFSAEYLGNKGYPSEFLLSSSANELKSIVKDEFVKELKNLPGGSRLNQFIERNLLSALQSPLKSPENNQMITEAQKFKFDIDKKKIEITDRLLNQYEAAGREPPANLSRLVDEGLKDYTQEKLIDLTQTFKDIKEGKIKSEGAQRMEVARSRIQGRSPKAGFTWMIFPDGSIKQAPTREIKKWQGVGGELIR